MPFPSTGGQTIVATMGVNTQPAVQALNQLPQHVKNALNQATTHTTSFSESFGKLFARGDVGERRFHGLVESMVKDLSSVQGGATGAAQAVTSVFTRISGFGVAGGAVLAAAAVGFERLVERGAELEKQTGDTNKELQRMGHVLKMSTAAEGFTALAAKAQEFHKQERKERDEANKEEEHSFRRRLAREALDIVRHPIRELLHPREAEEARVKKGEHAREAEAKFAEAVRREDELAVQAQQKSAEIAQAQLSGSSEQAESLKLQLEYMQKLADVQQLARRDPARGAEALAALNEEFGLRQRMIQAQAAAAERQFQASMKQAQLSRQSAADQDKLADIQISALGAEEKALAIARERGDLAVDRIESAKAEVQAAEDELEASRLLTTEDQRRAQLRLQNAQTAEAEARTAAKGAAAGVADERAKAIEQGATERRLTPEEQRKQYQERTKEWESTVQELAHRGLRGDLAEPPKMGEPQYDALRKFKAAAAQEELGRQQKLEQQMATPEGRQKLEEQQEKENPLLGAIKSDVATIAMIMQVKARYPDQPSSPQSGGGQAPMIPGQPMPQPGGGNPPPWSAGQLPPRGANATPVAGIRPDTVQDQGITPESYANTDWAKAQEIQNNADAFKNYWARPDVQAGIQGQQPEAPEAGPDWETGAGNFGPQPQPAATPEMQQQPPPAQPPAQPEPLPAPGGDQGGGGKGMVEAIKSAIKDVMDKYWR